jgi:hypothetical protein
VVVVVVEVAVVVVVVSPTEFWWGEGAIHPPRTLFNGFLLFCFLVLFFRSLLCLWRNFSRARESLTTASKFRGKCFLRDCACEKTFEGLLGKCFRGVSHGKSRVGAPPTLKFIDLRIKFCTYLTQRRIYDP